MIFKQQNHKYIPDIESELDFLKEFADDYCGHLFDQATEQVRDKVTVVFNDTEKPSVKSTMSKLIILVDSLLGKYKNAENRKFSRMLEGLKYEAECENRFSWEILQGWFSEEPFPDPEVMNDVEKVRDAIINGRRGYLIGGTYNHDKRTITLYKQNLDDSPVDYISVFAHEYFHAVHHFIIDEFSKELTDTYYSRVVMESLAVDFQANYLKERKAFSRAAEVLNRFRYDSPAFLPYAGVNYLGKKNGNASHFIVLYKSLLSFEKALGALIPMNHKAEYDIIMKKKL